MNCAKCHETLGDTKSLGPDLTLKREVTVEHLIQSLLDPSKDIHEGYESVIIQTDEGDTISGVLVERTDDALTLARIEKPDQPETFNLDDIEWKPSKLSTMRRDLLINWPIPNSFLIWFDIWRSSQRTGRTRCAIATRRCHDEPPSPTGIRNQIDHQALLATWNKDAFKRGEKIFSLHCASCHGTIESEGSMPTSLRFASGKFKNGNDPLAMYQTLTHGYGMMNAQRWMVPRQKYDVIHYIREHFLKEQNPTQYQQIDATYLAGLPKGNTMGPKPASSEPWVKMNYGPSFMNTIEVTRDGSNIAQKGIVVRVDDGPGGVESGKHWMMYEHDTMRVAATWSGQFIDWNGIHFNGRQCDSSSRDRTSTIRQLNRSRMGPAK